MIVTCMSHRYTPGAVVTQIAFSAEEVQAALEAYMATKGMKVLGPRKARSVLMDVDKTGAVYHGDERFGDALRYGRSGTTIDEVV